MKILFVASDNNKSSGAFLSMTTLCKLLREDYGVETTVVIPKEGEGIELLQDNNIPYIYIPSTDWVVPMNEKTTLKFMINRFFIQLRNHKSVFEIADYAQKHNFDIIHLNTSYPYVGALAAKKAKIPYVWHLRELLEEDQGRKILCKKRGYRLISKAAQIIAISTVVYDKYYRLLRNKNLIKIFNGIDTQKFYDPNHKIFCNPDKITMVYGGGYGRRKGPFSLLSSIRLVVDMGITNFELLLIGETNTTFKKAVDKYKLDNYVTYLGYQKNVNEIYSRSDIAFSTSVCEAFGRKTVEAMLSGTLIIASDTGGSIDIIKNGETGILYKEGNPLQLAERIIYAVNHQSIMRIIANNGRNFALENFNAKKNAEEIYNVYSKILSE